MPESASKRKPINEGRPFSWMDKERQRRISDVVPSRHRHPVIATYATLALFANDSGDRIFEAWITKIQEATGLSKNATTRSLNTLIELQLLAVRHTKRKDGTFGQTRFELTRGELQPLPLSGLEIGNGWKRLLEAEQDMDTASGSHGDRSPLRASKWGRSKEQRTRTKNPPTPSGLAGLDPLPHEDHPQTAPPSTSVPVPVQLSERLNALAIKVIQDFGLEKGNPTMALLPVRRMVAAYEEDMTFRALEWASRNASKNPISLAEIKLREGNHPWEDEPAPQKPKEESSDPVRAFIERQHFYQQLLSDRRSNGMEELQWKHKMGILEDHARHLLPEKEVYLAMSEYDFAFAVLSDLDLLPKPEIPAAA